jgi:hypothetical protein
VRENQELQLTVPKKIKVPKIVLLLEKFGGTKSGRLCRRMAPDGLVVQDIDENSRRRRFRRVLRELLSLGSEIRR